MKTTQNWTHLFFHDLNRILVIQTISKIDREKKAMSPVKNINEKWLRKNSNNNNNCNGNDNDNNLVTTMVTVTVLVTAMVTIMVRTIVMVIVTVMMYILTSALNRQVI